MIKKQPFEPIDIGLILSYKCQSACSHCVYNCGPDWQEWITVEDIKTAISATKNWNHQYQVHITGGEPFLNFDLVLSAVQTAVKMNISCYAETNAGWCLQESFVVEKFKQLKDAGLKGIIVSCSPFHAEKIPPIRTFTAINVAYRIFGPHRIMIYRPEWMKIISRYGITSPIPLDYYIRHLGINKAGKLLWHGYGLISGGRSGYRLGYLTDKKPAIFFQGDNCEEDILYASHSHFDLYGNYISGFCGGLSLGNWHDLSDLLVELKNNEFPKIVRILIDGGPYKLFEFASDNFGYTENKDGYAGKCHLCVDIRKHLFEFGKFLELSPDGFYEFL
jgi:hypothetical protein